MGDHRASIEIKFSIHGNLYTKEWWINYSPNHDGIDQRIVEWFDECWQEAYSKWQVGVDEYLAEQRRKETEEEELKELARLKEKYPDA